MGKKKITPNEFFIKIKNKFTYNKKSAFFSTVVIAIIVYFKVYANEIYNPDTLYVGINQGLDVWEMSLGRWGLSIVSLLRGSLVSTVATTFITQLIMVLVAAAKKSGGKLPRKVKFILDEFGNLPPIENFSGFR